MTPEDQQKNLEQAVWKLGQEAERLRRENAEMRRLLHDIDQTGPYDLTRLEAEFRWAMEAVRAYLERGV